MAKKGLQRYKERKIEQIRQNTKGRMMFIVTNISAYLKVFKIKILKKCKKKKKKKVCYLDPSLDGGAAVCIDDTPVPPRLKPPTPGLA